MTDVGVGFRDADGPLRAALVHCLDYMNDLPYFRAYKTQSYESLGIASGGQYLDVGCGVGFDVARMAERNPAAQFIGVDKSVAFLALARARADTLPNVAFIEGAAGALPFPDDSFDGARIDRSLQHVADPRAAIAEMARVVRPGGTIVATEPDWGTLLLDNGDRDASDRMAAKWRESIAHPAIGRELGALFESCGIVDLRARGHLLLSEHYEEAAVIYDLARLLENCVAAGLFSPREAEEWRWAAERATRAGSFLACLTIIERWGRVAPTS